MSEHSDNENNRDLDVNSISYHKRRQETIQTFIKKSNKKYNVILTIIVLLFAICILCFQFIKKDAFYKTFVMLFLLVSLGYIFLYIIRFISNKKTIKKLYKEERIKEINNELSHVRLWAQYDAIVTDNYFIDRTFILKIIKLDEIKEIIAYNNIKDLIIPSRLDTHFLTVKLKFILENKKTYSIQGYYQQMAEIYKGITQQGLWSIRKKIYITILYFTDEKGLL